MKPAVRLATILFFVLLVSLFPVPAFPQDAGPLHLRAIVRQKYPLLFVRGNPPDRPEGMAIDVLEAIASGSNISLSWVILPADADVVEPLQEGRGDFVVDWGKTASRSTQFDFSEPYITLPVNVYGGIHRDVTARKHLEGELHRSETERISAQKYEAVGKLAAGMAHHINNLMMIVGGYGSLLLQKMDPFDPRRKEVREILTAGDRAATITAQLLAFSRQSVLMAKVEAIDTLVEGSIPSLRSLLGEGIGLAVRKESAGVTVRADVRQLVAAIEELARNAKDAMPEGGRLYITTGTRTIGEPAGTHASSPAPGRYATVSVADTGCGMDREALSHLFEPFHTTKGFGRGMGLPSVYGFVKQSSGFIEAESAPGHGTTVTIGLPISGETASA